MLNKTTFIVSCIWLYLAIFVTLYTIFSILERIKNYKRIEYGYILISAILWVVYYCFNTLMWYE